MPWRSASGSLPTATWNRSFSATSPAIAYGLEQSMRILPSWSSVMNPKRGSIAVLTIVMLSRAARRDRLPVGQRRAAERVDADRDARVADGVHVDDLVQVIDVGRHEILLMRRRRLYRRARDVIRLTSAFLAGEQLVGAVLNPARDVGVGRPAVRRVVLEAAVLGRVVRRRDDDAVGEDARAAAVAHEDRARDDRRRRHPAVALNDRLDAVARQHLERAVLRQAPTARACPCPCRAGRRSPGHAR